MKYVPEINGIRAIAVLAVLLFHIELPVLQGGFVGVDAFFVISGYLITSIIAADLALGRFSFREFYARRMLRILPALYVVSLGTAVVFSLLFPPGMGKLLSAMFAGLLSLSNIWFYFTVDYFGITLAQPTLHYWSLAVEEQFYLALPLLFWLAWRRGGRRWALGLFVVLTLASLLAAGYVAGHDRSQAFYLPWLRAWELLVGSLLAFVHFDRLPRLLKRVLAEAGMLGLLACIWLYDDKMVFPGFSALPPVLATAALIAGAGSGSVAGWLLKTPPAQWFGKISYSLYLVHWPIICLVSLLAALTIRYQIGIVVLSVLLAWLSWRFVESRFRVAPSQIGLHRVFVRAGVATAACSVVFVAANFGAGQLWQNFPRAIDYANARTTDLAFFHRDTCFLTAQSDALSYFRQDLCLQQSTQRENVLVIGDSHAANIVDALKREFPHAQILQATAVGCKPVLGGSGAKRCTDLVDFIYRDWYPRHAAGIGKVVLASRWDASDLPLLNRTVEEMAKYGSHFVVYGPVPEYLVPVPLLLAYEEIIRMPLGARLTRTDRKPIDQLIAQGLSKRATYFSPFQNLCTGSACLLQDAGVALYLDRDHLTPRGAEMAVRGLARGAAPPGGGVG
jgi:peptidoglycan/LPS O-acetylase OafA/YrhL